MGPVGPQGPQGGRGDAGPQGIQGERGERGLIGPTGETGAIGPQGPAGGIGRSGVSAWERVVGTSVEGGSGFLINAIATCPTGKNVISGGYESTGGMMSPSAVIRDNFPYTDNAWIVRSYAYDGGSYSIRAWAICAVVD